MINSNKHLEQLEKDWRRLYPNGDTNNPLYEALCRAKGELIMDESSQIKERRNNASWCCDKIEDLIKQYYKRFNELSNMIGLTNGAKGIVYYEVIQDLESILYGEFNHE